MDLISGATPLKTTLQAMIAAAGLSGIEEMLRKANTPRATWYKWIGGTPPNANKMAQVAAVLGCSPGEALDAILQEVERRRNEGVIPGAKPSA